MDLSKLQNGSDVRGVALAGVENEPVTLDDAAVRAIAGGFARFLRARLGKESCRVSVGRDSRLSGGAIAETLCETLAALAGNIDYAKHHTYAPLLVACGYLLCTEKRAAHLPKA